MDRVLIKQLFSLYIMVIGKWASGNNPISRSFVHSSQLGYVHILKSSLILFVMVCANSFAKDYLRSPSCDHKETMDSFVSLSGWHLCLKLTGSLLLGAPDHFIHPFNSRRFLLFFLDVRAQSYCHKKMFCDFFRPKTDLCMCNISNNNIVLYPR